MTATLRCGYWSDPMCIWAYVAQDKLDRILTAEGARLGVDYHVIPVFGSIPWRLAEGPWKEGGLDGRVAATVRIAHEHGHPEVTGEVWRKGPTSSWPACAAVKAVFGLEADDELPGGSGAAYQWQLRRWFFADNLDTSHRREQLAAAEALDLPRGPIEARLDDGRAWAALWEDHNEAQQLQVKGSPTYVFDGGRAQLYGNFAYGILEATVHELVHGLEHGASKC